MNRILEKWESLSASSGIMRFLDVNLRSVGQVMFQNNPLTGILFLAAIALGGSYAATAPQVAIAGVLAVVVANLTARWLNANSKSLHAGLYGYNGILVDSHRRHFYLRTHSCGSMWCWGRQSRSSRC